MRVFTAYVYLCSEKNAKGKCLRWDGIWGWYNFVSLI